MTLLKKHGLAFEDAGAIWDFLEHLPRTHAIQQIFINDYHFGNDEDCGHRWRTRTNKAGKAGENPFPDSLSLSNSCLN